jgi:hypothetical protein
MNLFIKSVGIIPLLMFATSVFSQTDADAIMLNKKVLCIGGMYSYNSWKNYWEGTFKRDNENMGTVSTQMIGVMGNYGITRKLNVLFSLPYVQTKATDGTLKGLKGLQDLSFAVKWKAHTTTIGNAGTLSAFAIAGFSFPVSNYVTDFLPMSIGMHSKNLTGRGMLDYQVNKFFTTASAYYTLRSNIEIDRTSYYDTEMHLTNKVDMPDIAGASVRMGYRSRSWIAEGTFDRMNTLGGFDIRKNDMPFPSNNMDATMVGVNFKYTFLKKLRGLELTGGAKYTVAGRNVGQATIINGGVFYLMDLNKKNRKS